MLLQGLLLFKNDYNNFDKNVSTTGYLYSADGTNCLTVIASPSGFPDFRMLPCWTGVCGCVCMCVWAWVWVLMWRVGGRLEWAGV